MQGDKLHVVIDTDFLSSFLKIGRINLVKDFFNVEYVSIPIAVFTEIGKTDLVDILIGIDWIKIKTVKDSVHSSFNAEDFDVLGAGEKECMMLCKSSSPHLLLINDKKARQVAVNYRIAVLNISGFLLACKKSGFVSNDELPEIIADLRNKDYFEFSQEELELLKL
ncbi:MAG: hypothetical protein OIN89_09455 [Candidatus Methanoperedens sp.]|nr:hypothetical protein [Candidatus Methanoperedens sp.]PKL52767.1 MAG: hypothetical protein CVV36_10680 [Candidatus Methanoperedenaceae archaeon HGW-Methanoperedenaceae-1]